MYAVADEVHALGSSSEEDTAPDADHADLAFSDPLSKKSLRDYLRSEDLSLERSLTMRVDAASLPLELLGERLPKLQELKYVFSCTVHPKLYRYSRE